MALGTAINYTFIYGISGSARIHSFLGLSVVFIGDMLALVCNMAMGWYFRNFIFTGVLNKNAKSELDSTNSNPTN